MEHLARTDPTPQLTLHEEADCFNGLCEFKVKVHHLLAHYLEVIVVNESDDTFNTMINRLIEDARDFFPLNIQNSGSCFFK